MTRGIKPIDPTFVCNECDEELDIELRAYDSVCEYCADGLHNLAEEFEYMRMHSASYLNSCN